MKARLRSFGIGGFVATLLATGALMVPTAAAPPAAQAYGSCQMLYSVAEVAAANGAWMYVWEIWEHGIYLECW